ncbi:MAG TPA: SAM-dependent chlorinase/fluorinase, partial [Myxococcota bacterium]|nr:SAM-dependent chlorinase/fluorinase [Myxococcota bacterium]
MSLPLITLLTDFGWGSSYVAQLKGVILSSLPEARVVDVSHAVTQHGIREGELLLRGTAFAFPQGTVHVAVVDPGVGGARRPIAVASRGMWFVGPDNGLLAGPLAQRGARAVVLDRDDLFRKPVAPTFHGRDIFAPVACELAAGLTLEDVGSPLTNPVASTLPAPVLDATHVLGETLLADRFG